MTTLTHQLQCPNGKGYPPCSQTYAQVKARRDAIWSFDDGGTLEDLSPADYEAWNRADMELLGLQASGEHLGKSVRF